MEGTGRKGKGRRREERKDKERKGTERSISSILGCAWMCRLRTEGVAAIVFLEKNPNKMEVSSYKA